ncbi:MAG: hypothetical protein EOP04_22190 [Proteobacteria bacterium]|nr:MAG: hypothetical protein EOP04_22190 [Pseudomonadota bacterium]
MVEWTEPNAADGDFRLHLTSEDSEAQIWSDKHSARIALNSVLESLKGGQFVGTPQRGSFSSWTLDFHKNNEASLALRPENTWPTFVTTLNTVVKTAGSLNEFDWKDVRAQLALNLSTQSGEAISDSQFASVSSYFLCVGSYLLADDRLPAFVKTDRTIDATCSTARATAFQTLNISISDKTYKDSQSAGADLNYLPLDFLARRICPSTDSMSNIQIDSLIGDLTNANWIIPRANEAPTSLTNFRPRCLRHFYQEYLPSILSGIGGRALSAYPAAPEQARAALDAFVSSNKPDLAIEDVTADASKRLTSDLFDRMAMFPQIFSRLNDLDTKRLTGLEKTAIEVARAIVKPRFEETLFSKYLAGLSESDRNLALDRLGPVLVSKCKVDAINAECVKDSISDIVVFQVDLKDADSTKTLGFEVGSLSLAPL